MTREVGAITGELEVCTRTGAEGLELTVRYAGAEEWYAVEGSPILLGGTGTPNPTELHGRILEFLTEPGPVIEGNEEPTSLAKFSLP